MIEDMAAMGLRRLSSRVARCVVILAVALAAGNVASFALDTGAAAGNTGQEVRVSADRLVYERTTSVLRAVGNVVVQRGRDELKADHVTAKISTLDMWATGNVVYTRQKSAWKGDFLYCNMDTGRVHAEGESEFRSEPFVVDFEKGDSKKKGDEATGRDAVITTCALTPSSYHYHIWASSVTIVPGGDIVARNAVFYFYRVPILYLPYWRQSTTGRGFDFQPGYASRFGAFLLTGYGYDATDRIFGRTRLDYRTKRGWAVGQQFHGQDAHKKWVSDLDTYYAYDQLYAKGGGDAASPAHVDANRYRVLFKQSYNIDSRTYFIARLHYISDDELLDDFFRSEYRQESHPESYAYLKHNSQTYSVGGQVRVRLNDFYDTVERLPEVFVDISRQKIGNTFLYYDGRSAAAYLQKTVSKYSGGDDYSAVRLDSHHVLSVPAKIGFLSAVPRAGYRATFYSKTPVDTGGSGSESAEIDTTGKNVLRQMYEAGMDLSFKAFKVWRAPPGEDGGLRHVIEPYANFSYVTEPNVLAQDLYQFDQVDALGEKNELKLGARNKFQTKQKGKPIDKVDIDIWTIGNLNAKAGTDKFDTIGSDARFRIVKGLAVDMDGRYNFRGEGLKEVNTHLMVGNAGKLHGDIEHRYRADDRDLLLGDVSTDQNAPWSCGYDCRFDLQTSRLEEHSLRVKRCFDCLSLLVAFSQLPGYTSSDGAKRAEDYRISFKLSITALPNIGTSMEQRMAVASNYKLTPAGNENDNEKETGEDKGVSQ